MLDNTQYLDVFIDESMEHLDVLYQQLLALEQDPSDKSIIEEIFRAAHTIKGMSATMGYQDLANLTHNIENVFDKIRSDQLDVKANTIDVLFDSLDHMNQMVEHIANGGDGTRDVSDILAKLEMIESGEVFTGDGEDKNKPATLSDSESFLVIDEFESTILKESIQQGFSNYEITIQLTESCLLKGARVFMVFEVLDQLGEIIKSEPSVNDLEEENFDFSFSVLFVSNHSEEEIIQKINKVSEIEHVSVAPFSVKSSSENTQKEQTENESVSTSVKDKKTPAKEVKNQAPIRKTIRVNIERLDILMNLFEELVIDRGRLEQISLELDHNDLQETVERMTRVSGDLQNIILNMRMVPIDHVFNRFPGMIRQLARELDKDVQIDIIGADTELDRTVIDEIGDPLVHLIRNAMDHGIEEPGVRVSKGKPRQGTITLKAYHSGNHVFIEISDDGAGINKEKVLHKAMSNGVINEAQASQLSDQQIYELILASGFSTADSVSDVSGRGVGLDVVKNTIETLGGRISIDASENAGSIFSIQLPLTLSIISVLLIELQNEKYAIPLSSIIETVIIHKEDILSAHHKKVIDFRGKVVPLVFLNEIFSVPLGEKETDDHFLPVVIVRRGDKSAGLVVDSFIGQQEVVLKSLGNYLGDIPAISGATILGDGQVALIIDSNALVK